MVGLALAQSPSGFPYMKRMGGYESILTYEFVACVINSYSDRPSLRLSFVSSCHDDKSLNFL